MQHAPAKRLGPKSFSDSHWLALHQTSIRPWEYAVLHGYKSFQRFDWLLLSEVASPIAGAENSTASNSVPRTDDITLPSTPHYPCKKGPENRPRTDGSILFLI